MVLMACLSLGAEHTRIGTDGSDDAFNVAGARDPGN